MALARTFGDFVQQAALETFHASGLGSVLGMRHAGRGGVFMFHSAVPHRAEHLNYDLRASTGYLDRFLTSMAGAGIDVICIDDLIDRLTDENARRFVVVTFDDGYVDNLEHALPVFEKHNAPFTIYVSTGMITRQLYCWWIGLERLFLQNTKVEIAALGKRWVTERFDEKLRAYKETRNWVAVDVTGRAPLLSTVFERYGISMEALVGEIGLSPDQLVSLARHPLVTIGGHTVRHLELAKLADADAFDEIYQDKIYLEATMGRPVEHFAYPYGGETACGVREGQFARTLGYRTAVTTRHGCVSNSHLDCVHLLPRLGVTRRYESVSLGHVQVQGVVAALKDCRALRARPSQ